MQIVLAHPSIAQSVYRIFLITRAMMIIIDSNIEKIPEIAENANGFVEKPMIPSIE